ncbi:MAG: VWA domain-containing protein [Candidatus Gracilibacteria bacterium]|nr:VWA domain-containing protein [Candidatus Gracilibacteria bacterium]
MIFLSIAFLGPVGLIKKSAIATQGIDCIWLLDVSTSMDVEESIEETSPLSRLARAKSIIESYIISHPENQYGLVIFSGKSRLVSPLTMEHSSLLNFLASIDSKSIREGGTDFREALTTTVERFETKENTPHAIILLSDGGDMDESIDTKSIQDILRGKYINLITIGVGQAKPSPILIGRNPFGEPIFKQFQGEIVLSGLNKKNLKQLADIGKGSYLEESTSKKELEKALDVVGYTTLLETKGENQDATVQFFILLSFGFFLIFHLFPFFFSKKGNTL